VALKEGKDVNRKPAKVMQMRSKPPKAPKNVPRGTISDPKPTFVYRKDAFKKVKIT
jgi:hypothetical protein